MDPGRSGILGHPLSRVMTSDICGDLSSRQLFSKDINIGGTAYGFSRSLQTPRLSSTSVAARNGGDKRREASEMISRHRVTAYTDLMSSLKEARSKPAEKFTARSM